MICEKNKCTGCFACYNICPKKAIKMVENEFGYIYPEIDKKKCIECNMCKKVCPSINNVIFNYPIHTFAMIAKNNNTRKESSSGGAATIFSETIIKSGGVVYGCTYTKGCHINHIRVDNLNDLELLKGSKYVHSYVLDTFSKVKEDLIQKKKVLYIGTPCQIAGLKNFIGNKEYSKYLNTIDLVCHGVPSQKYLHENLIDADNTIVSFRTEKGYVLRETKDDNIISEVDSRDSLYYRAFFEALIFRENCYTCQYAKQERCSDITLGDFWGLGDDSKFSKTKNEGVSLILINTEKGLDLLNKSNDRMELEERTIQEAAQKNGQLNSPKSKSDKYEIFQKQYLKKGFIKAYKNINRFGLFKNKLRKIKILDSIYKKIKK